MAINRAVRKRTPVATEPELLAATCVDGETPLTAALASERRIAGPRAGLGRLGDLDRDTLVAFYVEGQSLVEMSQEFQLAGRHDQAAAARRPQAAGQGVGRVGGRLRAASVRTCAGQTRSHVLRIDGRVCRAEPGWLDCYRCLPAGQTAALFALQATADGSDGHSSQPTIQASAADWHDVYERLDAVASQA